MADIRIVLYDAFADMLTHGVKSMQFQLNIPDESEGADAYASKPLCDGGKTLDSTLRKARTRALASHGRHPVIIVKAFTLAGPIGTICEVIDARSKPV